ncbi:MAG: shikimate kinase [Cyanobacteriota bacterium]|nr:shikimate kinase [Cyanobacteriota bacterium]
MDVTARQQLGIPLKGANLYLVGMMGSGKTTVGALLAEKLGYQFFDTDRVIEQLTGEGIPSLFARQGEAVFREMETQVLAELAAFGRLVVATGGGIVQRPQNWSYLHHGIVIWLDVALDQLWLRLQSDPQGRPLLQTADPLATLQQLMQQRQPFYAQADVHVQITEAASPQQISEWVWAQVQRRLKA